MAQTIDVGGVKIGKNFKVTRPTFSGSRRGFLAFNPENIEERVFLPEGSAAVEEFLSQGGQQFEIGEKEFRQQFAPQFAAEGLNPAQRHDLGVRFQKEFLAGTTGFGENRGSGTQNQIQAPQLPQTGGGSRGIQSAQFRFPDGSVRRIQVGSKAFENAQAQGATLIGGTGTNIQTGDIDFQAAQQQAQVGGQAQPIAQQQIPFTRQLDLGARGEDVRALQRFLNKQGFRVAESGAGSPGNETNFFGPLTQKALQRFQASQGIVTSGTPQSTGFGRVGPQTLEALKSSFGQDPLDTVQKGINTAQGNIESFVADTAGEGVAEDVVPEEGDINITDNADVAVDSDVLTGIPTTSGDIQSLIDENLKLRERFLASLEPSENELQLQEQLVDLRDRTRKDLLDIGSQPIPEGFIVGQQREQLELLQAEEANLLDRLGLAQEARQVKSQGLETALNFVRDDINLQFKIQDRLRQQRQDLERRKERLDDKQREQLRDITAQLEGVDPNILDAQSLATIKGLSDSLGISFGDMFEAMQVNYNEFVADKSGVLPDGSDETTDNTDLDIPSFEQFVKEVQEETGQQIGKDSVQTLRTAYDAEVARIRAQADVPEELRAKNHFTPTQLARGAAKAGMTITEFSEIHRDEANDFVFGDTQTTTNDNPNAFD